MRILITDGMDAGAIAQLQADGHQVVQQYYPPEELGAALQGFDCVVIRSKTKIWAPHIDHAAAGNLRLIIRGGVGVDNIDVAYATTKGIVVRNTPNASSASVAELALGHIFALSRHIAAANVTMRSGQWNKNAYTGTEIGGKTLGLIGMGRIAKELAKRAKALGMQVVYTCRSGPKKSLRSYTYMHLEQLLQTADYVSLHIPATQDRKPLLSRRELALMKPTAYLINTARGSLVDEQALVEALDNGIIAGAGLDVFAEEPSKNPALYTHPRVSVTPHIGGQTEEAQSRIGQEIVAIIKAFEKE